MDGWYLGPALDSYRCYTIWMFDTKQSRICDTVQGFPTKVPMPTASTVNVVVTGIKDIVQALIITGTNLPLVCNANSQVTALHNIYDILTNATGTATIHNNTADTSLHHIPTAIPIKQ